MATPQDDPDATRPNARPLTDDDATLPNGIRPGNEREQQRQEPDLRREPGQGGGGVSSDSSRSK